jgi:hypothetical protein
VIHEPFSKSINKALGVRDASHMGMGLYLYQTACSPHQDSTPTHALTTLKQPVTCAKQFVPQKPINACIFVPELPERVIEPRLVLLRLLPPTLRVAHRSFNVPRPRLGCVVELFLETPNLLVTHLVRV